MNADPGSLCLPLHIMSPVITGYRVTSPATDASQAQARAPDLPSESPCDAIPCRKVSRGLAGACTRFRLAGVHTGPCQSTKNPTTPSSRRLLTTVEEALPQIANRTLLLVLGPRSIRSACRRPHGSVNVPKSTWPCRPGGVSKRTADSLGNAASRASMIPLYGSGLCVGLDRGAYCVLPAPRSRSNWPVSIQWWIVPRLILNCLDSSTRQDHCQTAVRGRFRRLGGLPRGPFVNRQAK